MWCNVPGSFFEHLLCITSYSVDFVDFLLFLKSSQHFVAFSLRTIFIPLQAIYPPLRSSLSSKRLCVFGLTTTTTTTNVMDYSAAITQLRGHFTKSRYKTVAQLSA